MTNQTQNKRDSFIFYRSFFEATKCLENEEKAKLFDAICSYALDNNSLNLEGTAKGMFGLIKPQLDANRKRFENGCRKKQNINKAEAKQKQNISKTEANVNVNVNENVNYNLNDLPSIESEVTNNTNTNIVIVENKKENESKLKEKKLLAIYEDLPHFIDKGLFNSFAEMRIKIKKPMTTKARELVIKDLIKLENSKQGNANLSLENSIKNSWQSVYEPKLNNYSNNTNQGTTTRFMTTQETKQQADKDQIDRLLRNRGLK